MKAHQKKCTLFLKSTSKSDKINYTITPAPYSVDKDDSFIVYNFIIDTTQLNIIKIKIDKIFNVGDCIVVDKILINDHPIDNLDAVSFLRTSDNQIKRTYGYIDCCGEFIIKIRNNLVSLNYLNYLLSLTN